MPLSHRLAAAAAAALLARPAPAWGHDLTAVGPGELWRSWTLDPWIVLPIVLSAWVYRRGTRAVWAASGRGRGVSVSAARCFAGGIVALIVALVSPLDALGGALFSAHMLQHVVLMLVAAPLLTLGRPLVALLWALPPHWRARVGGVGRAAPVRRAWPAISSPLGAWTLHAAALWIWHAPALYEATLHSELVHLAQHFCFFGSALLFWWAAFELGRRTHTRQGIGVVYIFTTAVHSSVLGALLTFSLVLWYPAYEPFTTAWGLTALEDQQLGGLIMWVPAGVVYLFAALALVAAWIAAAELQSNRSGTRGAPAPVRQGAGRGEIGSAHGAAGGTA
jgi:putative membrane protein